MRSASRAARSSAARSTGRRWSAGRSGPAAGRSAARRVPTQVRHAVDARLACSRRSSTRLATPRWRRRTCLRATRGRPGSRAGSNRGRTAAAPCPCRRCRARTAPSVAPMVIQRCSTHQFTVRRKRAVERRVEELVRAPSPAARLGLAAAACRGRARSRPTRASEITSAIAVTAKIAKVYSPTVDFARPIGRKPAAVISVPVSIGIAVDVVGEGGGAHLVVALLHLAHHHLDRDDRVVHQQAQRDDQRAERDLVQADAPVVHDQEGDGQHQRDRDAPPPGPAACRRRAPTQPRLECAGPGDEADRQHDHHGLDQRARRIR